MAIIKNNPLLKEVSGHLGKIVVYKNYSFGVVLSNYPDMSKVKPSKKQLKEKDRFGDAVRFAQSILADPKKKLMYQKKIGKGKSVYHAAIAEHMKKTKE